MPYVSKRTAREVFEEYLSNGELAQGRLLTQRSQRLVTEKNLQQLEFEDENVETTERSIFTKSSLMPPGGDAKALPTEGCTSGGTARKPAEVSNHKNMAYYATPVAKISIPKKDRGDASSQHSSVSSRYRLKTALQRNQVNVDMRYYQTSFKKRYRINEHELKKNNLSLDLDKLVAENTNTEVVKTIRFTLNSPDCTSIDEPTHNFATSYLNESIFIDTNKT